MIGKNECVFMGKLAGNPVLTDSPGGLVARTTIIVSNKGNSNRINIITFGDTAKILSTIGYKNAGIYAEGRVEVSEKETQYKKAKVPTFVVDKFYIFEPPRSPITQV